MSNNIEDKKGNYEVVRNILSSRYQEVNGYDFYRYIFPDNQNVGELSGNYSKPNAIYLYRDEEEDPDRTYRRRIMLNDTWEDDYMNYVGLPPTKRGNPPLRNKYSKNS